MQKEEIRKRMENLFRASVAAGVVKNKSDFSNLTGLSKHTIYCALNGYTDYLNVRLLYRMEGAVRSAGISIDSPVCDETSIDTEGSIEALITELAEQRKMFTEQLRIKDEQIAKFQKIFQTVLSEKK